MTDVQILHDQLLTKLGRAVGSVVDIDTRSELAIEVAATALTDMLGIVLARLPAAENAEGASVIGIAMGNRLARRMALEVHGRSGMLDLSGAKSLSTEPVPADAPAEEARGEQLN